MINFLQKLMMILVMSLLAAVVIAADESALSNSSDIAHNKMIEPVISVSVKGMVCDFCARGLEKVFKKRQEVSSIDVDLSKNLILINLKYGMTLDDDVIKKLVVANGISVVSINRDKSPLVAPMTKASKHKNHASVKYDTSGHGHDHADDNHSAHH